MFDPIALDLREQNSGAIFAMARNLTALIEDQGTLTLTLVTGETLDARDVAMLADRLVTEAIWRKHRGIAKRLYDAYTAKVPRIGQLVPTFEQKYGTSE